MAKWATKRRIIRKEALIMLLGRLIYFYKILDIESQRPICEDMLDEYYRKRQEELKLFFDRHVTFYQYYKSGGTYLDTY